MFAMIASAHSKRARASEPDEVVVTATRTPERAQRSTVKTDVVTRKDAEQRGATNVAEALQSQPAVVVNPGAYGNMGGVSAVQIQGLDRDRVLVLEDGERVVGDVGGAIDLSTIPVADLSRIEIVTGPTSSLYGASAIGGVINIVTGPPSRNGLSGVARAEVRSQPGYVLIANGAYRKESAWIGLDANAVGAGALSRVPDLPDRTIPETARRMVGARGGFRFGRSDIRLRARAFDMRTDGLSSMELPNLGRFITDLPSETQRFTLHAIDAIDLGHGSSLRITLGSQWLKNESANDRRDSPIDELRRREHGLQSFESILTLADGSRTWVAGARFEAERFNQNLTRTDAIPGGLQTTTNPEVTPQMFGVAAGYAQLSWKLSHGFTLLAGARAEGHTRYGGTIAPRVAAAFRPNDAWQLRISGGRGFRAPSAKELGFAFDHSVLGYRVIGNSNLKPETSWGLNADATFTPNKRITARISAFVNWIDDLIDIDLARGKPSRGVVDYAYRNIGGARTMGAQASFGYRTSRFRADLAYDYLYTRDEVADAPLPGRPPHTLTAALQATTVWKIDVTARFRVASDAFLTVDARTPGYESLDLRVSRPLWPRAEIYGGILNLTDVHQDEGRAGDLRPVIGRVLYAGIRGELPWEEEESK
jgi:outer membrane receptor for ferrienterochelin and colicins